MTSDEAEDKNQEKRIGDQPESEEDQEITHLPLKTLRSIIYGEPLSTQQSDESRLRKLLALPVFCSDAISSVAYGPQQILLAFCMVGLWVPQYAKTYSHNTFTIAALIVLVLVLVAISYWQTIMAYPGGGGSYTVTRDNLGVRPGLAAAAALLIDYVLCVAVSIASGIQNLRDVPLLAGLHIGDHMVLYSFFAIMFMTWLNLRGLKTPGVLFAVPVYVFIGMCYLMIVIGLGAEPIGWQLHKEYANQVLPAGAGVQASGAALSIAVMLRAFATGCSALTGVECCSNGIPAFKAPQQKNAAITLVWMSIILGTILAGIAALAIKFHIVYWESHGTTAAAVIDQISGTVFDKSGPSSLFYNLTQFSTALILMVAAQTSFADFPRVTSILAKDGFMPRQLSNVGDRLAFDNGILILGILSTLFIIVEKGSVDLLIPFFTIGVFLAFTMSQSGMVRHWFKLKGKGWALKAFLNGLGALATFVVLVDIVVEKLFDGAWFVIVLMLLLLFCFKKIKGHYVELAKNLNVDDADTTIRVKENTVLVLVQGVHAGTIKALTYARSISEDYKALYVEIDPERTQFFSQQWQKFCPEVPLVILRSPYRSLVTPIMLYLDDFHEHHPDDVITVVICEFVSTKWWHSLLHGNTGLMLKLAFLARKDVVVANVRYWIN